MRNIDDNELDVLVCQLAGDESFLVDTERLATVSSATVLGEPRRTRRPPAVWIAIGLASLLGLGLAAPALADGFRQLAQTGRYGPVTTESDESEWIDSSAADFADYASSIYPDWLPLPAGLSVEVFRTESIDQLATMVGESQESAILSTFEHNARCLWADEWLQANDAGDDATADAAALVLAESVGWPATVDIAGGGFLEHLTEVADAATNGDRTIVSYHLESDCASMPVGLL